MKNLKKMLTLLLAAATTLALVACGGNGNASGSTPGSASGSNGGNSSVEVDPNATLGETLKAVFEANADQDAETLANTILANEQIEFATAVMPVEPGYLPGFNADIDGFKSAVSFGPMISTIPFVGYIFELEEDADVDAFVAELEANANLRWNVCTEAEEMVTATEGNTVFFLMCPKSLEMEE